MCSETSEAVGTTWEHAQLEFQNFLKIRITLMDQASGEWTRRDELKKVRVYHQHCLPLCLAFVSA